jgi:hypothetical protein
MIPGMNMEGRGLGSVWLGEAEEHIPRDRIEATLIQKGDFQPPVASVEVLWIGQNTTRRGARTRLGRLRKAEEREKKKKVGDFPGTHPGDFISLIGEMLTVVKNR